MKYIKIRALLFTALLSANASHALELVTFGVKAGLGAVNHSMTNVNYSALGTKIGLSYLGGGSIDVGVGPFGGMADILFASRGYKISYTDPTYGIVNVGQRMNSLMIPVQARFSTGLIQFSAGGYWSLGLGNVSTSTTVAATGQAVSNVSSSYALQGLNRSNLGLTIGAGVSIVMFSVEIRYNHGITDMTVSPLTFEKSRSVDLLAGMTF